MVRKRYGNDIFSVFQNTEFIRERYWNGTETVLKMVLKITNGKTCFSHYCWIHTNTNTQTTNCKHKFNINKNFIYLIFFLKNTKKYECVKQLIIKYKIVVFVSFICQLINWSLMFGYIGSSKNITRYPVNPNPLIQTR